ELEDQGLEFIGSLILEEVQDDFDGRTSEERLADLRMLSRPGAGGERGEERGATGLVPFREREEPDVARAVLLLDEALEQLGAVVPQLAVPGINIRNLVRRHLEHLNHGLEVERIRCQLPPELVRAVRMGHDARERLPGEVELADFDENFGGERSIGEKELRSEIPGTKQSDPGDCPDEIEEILADGG